ncbi:hypothetical protein GGX14DRAFT_637654 [Mycena pura]|uniref:Uncharacterized protein n=1 Tax=Mycena pura TaxID=153505 RepID=A0AAD6V9K5_9AGAR|nr:hypothetical protein GGX14DRAFT_637654 [Mycena pura]
MQSQCNPGNGTYYLVSGQAARPLSESVSITGEDGLQKLNMRLFHWGPKIMKSVANSAWVKVAVSASPEMIRPPAAETTGIVLATCRFGGRWPNPIVSAWLKVQLKRIRIRFSYISSDAETATFTQAEFATDFMILGLIFGHRKFAAYIVTFRTSESATEFTYFGALLALSLNSRLPLAVLLTLCGCEGSQLHLGATRSPTHDCALVNMPSGAPHCSTAQSAKALLPPEPDIDLTLESYTAAHEAQCIKLLVVSKRAASRGTWVAGRRRVLRTRTNSVTLAPLPPPPPPSLSSPCSGTGRASAARRESALLSLPTNVTPVMRPSAQLDATYVPPGGPQPRDQHPHACAAATANRHGCFLAHIKCGCPPPGGCAPYDATAAVNERPHCRLERRLHRNRGLLAVPPSCKYALTLTHATSIKTRPGPAEQTVCVNQTASNLRCVNFLRQFASISTLAASVTSLPASTSTSVCAVLRRSAPIPTSKSFSLRQFCTPASRHVSGPYSGDAHHVHQRVDPAEFWFLVLLNRIWTRRSKAVSVVNGDEHEKVAQKIMGNFIIIVSVGCPSDQSALASSTTMSTEKIGFQKAEEKLSTKLHQLSIPDSRCFFLEFSLVFELVQFPPRRGPLAALNTLLTRGAVHPDRYRPEQGPAADVASGEVTHSRCRRFRHTRAGIRAMPTAYPVQSYPHPVSICPVSPAQRSAARIPSRWSSLTMSSVHSAHAVASRLRAALLACAGSGWSFSLGTQSSARCLCSRAWAQRERAAAQADPGRVVLVVKLASTILGRRSHTNPPLYFPILFTCCARKLNVNGPGLPAEVPHAGEQTLNGDTGAGNGQKVAGHTRDELELVLVFRQKGYSTKIEVDGKILTFHHFSGLFGSPARPFKLNASQNRSISGTSTACGAVSTTSTIQISSKKELKDPGVERTTAAAG